MCQGEIYLFAVQEESLEIYYRWYFSIPRQLYISSLIVSLVYVYIVYILLLLDTIAFN